MTFDITVKSLYNDKNMITGVVVSAFKNDNQNIDEMILIIKHHVHQKIFKGQGINFFPSVLGGYITIIAFVKYNELSSMSDSIDYKINITP